MWKKDNGREMEFENRYKNMISETEMEGKRKVFKLIETGGNHVV